jgi:uncharacterized protein YggU (UPF0235/DUF167 family)
MRYNVTVKFNTDGIEVDNDTIIIGIKSKPERGKANLELIDKLARHFGIPKTNVRIMAGFTSRKKIVDILIP